MSRTPEPDDTTPIHRDPSWLEADLAARSAELRDTEWAPSLASPQAADDPAEMRAFDALRTNDSLGPFTILGCLGRGGFGVVYLAHEEGLDRLVALKLSPDTGSEGRHLAQLDHPNIVQVFSESIDPRRRVRWLCMQYIPGATLAQVIDRLRHDGRLLNGHAILQVLDSYKPRHARFDPSSLSDRTKLESADSLSTICQLGADLADALQHAHQRGVLHLDLKPSNILFNLYGRPYLSDFNLAFAADSHDPHRPALLGGTLPYMPPEQLRALDPATPNPLQNLDGRSDVFALGVVLYELLTGKVPFPHTEPRLSASAVASMLERRETEWMKACHDLPNDATWFRPLLQQCLHPDPQKRFADAHALGDELRGMRARHQAIQQQTPTGWLARWLEQGPSRIWVALITAGVLPHLVGSVVQITYNLMRIVDALSPAQQEAFQRLVYWVNPIVYGICLTAIGYFLARVYTPSRELSQQVPLSDTEVERMRQRLLAIPEQAAWIGGSAWFLSGIIFPVMINHWAGPIASDVWIHFAISFALAGSIAVTYAYIFSYHVIRCYQYLQYWLANRQFEKRAPVELRRSEFLMQRFVSLAGWIPIAAAMLVIGVGPDEFTPDAYRGFRLLVSTLIVSGMIGARLATRLGRGTASSQFTAAN